MMTINHNLDLPILGSRLNLQCVMFNIPELQLKFKISFLFKEAENSAGINWQNLTAQIKMSLL